MVGIEPEENDNEEECSRPGNYKTNEKVGIT
jgi:hypothetical protein